MSATEHPTSTRPHSTDRTSRHGASAPPPRVPRRVWAIAAAAGAAASLLAFLVMPNQGSGLIELDGDEALQEITAEYLEGMESRAQGLLVLHRDATGATAQLTGGSIDGEARPSSDTPFETGSVWKVLTAMLLADLAEDGVTAPDRALGEIYGDFDFADPAVAEVTLEELATHSSGLPRIAEDTMAAAMASELVTAADPYRTFPDPAESLAVARLHTPGEYAYSNFGYAILGQALEREADTPYPELVRARLLEPLDMTDSIILGADADTPPDRAALPYAEAGTRSQAWHAVHYAPAGIGTWSTAEDLMRLLEAVQQETAPGMDALDIAYDAPEDAEMGLGWMRTPMGEWDMTWHSGGTFGSAAFIGIGGGEAVVALSNSFQLDPSGLGAAVLGAPEPATAAEVPTAAPTPMLLGITLLLTVPPAVLAPSLMAGRKTLITRRPLDRLRLVSMPLGAAAVVLFAQHYGSWSVTPSAVWALAVGAVVAALVAGAWLWPRTPVLRARVRALRLACFGLSVTVSALLGATAIYSLAVAQL